MSIHCFRNDKIFVVLLFLQNESIASNRQLKYGSTTGVVASRDAAGRIINFVTFKNGSIKKDKFPSTDKLIGSFENKCMSFILQQVASF